MTTQEIIEKAVINLVVAKTKLELEQQKTIDDKDYWYEQYKEQRDKHEKASDQIDGLKEQLANLTQR